LRVRADQRHREDDVRARPQPADGFGHEARRPIPRKEDAMSATLVDDLREAAKRLEWLDARREISELRQRLIKHAEAHRTPAPVAAVGTVSAREMAHDHM